MFSTLPCNEPGTAKRHHGFGVRTASNQPPWRMPRPENTEKCWRLTALLLTETNPATRWRDPKKKSRLIAYIRRSLLSVSYAAWKTSGHKLQGQGVPN